jgi:hypothetical protein
MAIDFPNSPTTGDIHTVSGKRWEWDGEKWTAYGASLAPDVLKVDVANNRVGINDTTPSYSLDVNGTARVTGAITTSGSVGIGETAPASDLVVRADSAGGRGGEITILNYAATTVGNEAALNFGLENSTYAGDAGNAQIKAYQNNVSGAADLVFSNWTGGAFTEHLRILSDGKVGIGTASPAHTLHVEGTPLARDSSWSSSGDLAIWTLGSSVGAAERFGVGYKHSTGMIMSVYKSSAGGSFGANSYDAMTILDTSGYVGIGTTSPTAMLHIVDAGNATRMDRSGYDSYGWVHSAGGGIQWYNYTDSRTETYYAGDGRVAIGTTTVVGQSPSLTLGGTGASEGGQLNFAGGSSYGNELYLDRHGNNLRMIYNGASVFEIEPTGSLTFLDTAQLKCGSGNDLLIYANGSNSFIDHNGDGDLWIRVLGAGENMYLNTSTSAKILIQRNSVSQMEFRDGASTHGGTHTAYGGVGFSAASVYLDRNWGNYPGITVCNTTIANGTTQGEFRLHGANHTFASYPGTGGSDFGVVTRSDGGFATGSDERRKENITTISGALATVNSLRGVEFNTIIRDGSQETLATIGGKMYGFIGQEAKDLIPNAVTYYPDEDEPLESGWCSAYSINYAPVTAVLVEAIKELTARLEALEAG